LTEDLTDNFMHWYLKCNRKKKNQKQEESHLKANCNEQAEKLIFSWELFTISILNLQKTPKP